MILEILSGRDAGDGGGPRIGERCGRAGPHEVLDLRRAALVEIQDRGGVQRRVVDGDLVNEAIPILAAVPMLTDRQWLGGICDGRAEGAARVQRAVDVKLDRAAVVRPHHVIPRAG